MSSIIKLIAEDEGGAINKEIENQVIGQLDKSAKMDEIDTVTFGLETDDGKIVKVYVNADQADDFEKALADKLGEIDDIEQCLNDLSKEYEIVDVEWPDDSSGDDDDEEDEGQPETDGSEVMNQKVYDNSKESEAKTKRPKFEEKTSFKKTVLVESPGSVESRMSTPAQLLVYHAIIELGIPEIALDKSPYKSTIINSIKAKASDLNKYPTLKSALKMFIRRAHGIEYDEKLLHEGDVGGFIAESLQEDFWGCVNKILKYLALDSKHADDFINCSKFKMLVSRSGQVIPRVVDSQLRMKMQKLSDSLDANDAMSAAANKPKISESVSPEVATSMFNSLFALVDPTPNKTVSNTLLNSPEFKQYFMSAKSELASKFGGAMSQKFIDFCKALGEAADKANPPKPTNGTSGTGSEAPAPTGTQPTSEATSRKARMLKEGIEWEFSKDGDTAVASTEGFKMTLDPEQLEKAVKAVESKSVVVVKDAADPTIKYSLSPRGTILAVRKVGDDTFYQMNADQIQDFMNLVSTDEEKKSGDEEE